MAAWFWGILITAAAVGLSLGGMLLVRRSVPPPVLARHNEVAGFIYAVLGVVYAVLLAFVVIAVWERHEAAEATVAQEANELGDLFRDAAAFPEPARSRMRMHIRGYAQAVLAHEWPAMAAGKASPPAGAAFDRLWQAYLLMEPRTGSEQVWYAESLGRLNELGDYRRLRLLSREAAVPGVVWAVLLVGGVVTIAFSFLFGTPDARAQAVMVAALSGVIALVLFLIVALERPFAGIARVRPAAFEQVTAVFDRWGQPAARPGGTP